MMTDTEKILHEYISNTQEASGLSWEVSKEIVLSSHPHLVHKAAREAEQVEFEGLTPSERVVHLARRHSQREYDDMGSSGNFKAHPIPPTALFGDFIKRRREELKISAKELGLASGAEAGFAESIIDSIEKGDFGFLNHVRLSLVAKKLKVPLKTLTDLIPVRDSSGKKVRSRHGDGGTDFQAPLTREAILKVAERDPAAWEAYELNGRSTEMTDASNEVVEKAKKYMDTHRVNFADGVAMVLSEDESLRMRYDRAC